MNNFVLKKYKEFYEKHGYVPPPYLIRTTVQRLKMLPLVLPRKVVAQRAVGQF